MTLLCLVTVRSVQSHRAPCTGLQSRYPILAQYLVITRNRRHSGPLRHPPSCARYIYTIYWSLHPTEAVYLDIIYCTPRLRLDNVWNAFSSESPHVTNRHYVKEENLRKMSHNCLLMNEYIFQVVSTHLILASCIHYTYVAFTINRVSI